MLEAASLSQRMQLAQRVERLLPQYRAWGYSLIDQATLHTYHLNSLPDVQALTFGLLRLQRGPRLADRPRLVVYALGAGGAEVLLCRGQPHWIRWAEAAHLNARLGQQLAHLAALDRTETETLVPAMGSGDWGILPDEAGLFGQAGQWTPTAPSPALTPELRLLEAVLHILEQERGKGGSAWGLG